jgi:hypothetical protein
LRIIDFDSLYLSLPNVEAAAATMRAKALARAAGRQDSMAPLAREAVR